MYAQILDQMTPAARETALRLLEGKRYLEYRQRVLECEGGPPHPTGGGLARRTLLAAYCGQDCMLPVLLMRRTGTLEGLIAMSRVTNTSIRNLLTRGQQIKVFSQIYLVPCRACPGAAPTRPPHPAPQVTRRHKMVMSQPPPDVCELQGATVLDPIRGLTLEPVATFDFASLYPNVRRPPPSPPRVAGPRRLWRAFGAPLARLQRDPPAQVIRSRNICYCTYLGITRRGGEQAPRVAQVPAEERWDVPTADAVVSFVKEGRRPGILPLIEHELLTARKVPPPPFARVMPPRRRPPGGG
jgi:hypothetical protein